MILNYFILFFYGLKFGEVFAVSTSLSKTESLILFKLQIGELLRINSHVERSDVMGKCKQKSFCCVHLTDGG